MGCLLDWTLRYAELPGPEPKQAEPYFVEVKKGEQHSGHEEEEEKPDELILEGT